MDINLLLVGVGLAAFTILIAMAYPKPTPFQLLVFRVIIALAAAMIAAAAIPGALEINSKFISAGGAIGVFVLVYALNPAALIKSEPATKVSKTKQDQEMKREAISKRASSLQRQLQEPPPRRRPTVNCAVIIFGMLICVAIGLVATQTEAITLSSNTKSILCGISAKNLPFLNCPLAINEKQQSSNVKDFTITLKSIEYLENGKIRWYFQFWNQSDSLQNLGFDYRDTYLFDEFGNHYPVVGCDTKPDANNSFSEEVQMGVQVNHWFEFPSPVDDAKVFNFVLADNHLIPIVGGPLGGVEFSTPVFTINVNEY